MLLVKKCITFSIEAMLVVGLCTMVLLEHSLVALFINSAEHDKTTECIICDEDKSADLWCYTKRTFVDRLAIACMDMMFSQLAGSEVRKMSHFDKYHKPDSSGFPSAIGGNSSFSDP